MSLLLDAKLINKERETRAKQGTNGNFVAKPTEQKQPVFIDRQQTSTFFGSHSTSVLNSPDMLHSNVTGKHKWSSLLFQ